MNSSRFSPLAFIASFVLLALVLLAAITIPFVAPARARPDPAASAAFSPAVWRAERRIVDMHMHIEGKAERFERAVGIMDRAGLGIGVVLGAGTITHKQGEKSEFERVKELADTKFPGRFVHHMLIDYDGWDDAGWSERAAQQVVEGHRLGAAGLKEFKRLGLFLRDGKGALIKVDDPKLDAVWEKCGELGMPVSIHVADPRAFWLPFEAGNERWKELRDHRNWWFGDRSKFPERIHLLDALNRVIERHPRTTFVSVHFANNAEEIDWVERALDTHPNMMADVAARLPEIGRHPPEPVRRLFLKHQDRILFGTDFMVYDRLILGSAGDAERPTDDDALTFYQKCWRFFETNDRDWPHMTPIQGDWTISSIELPPTALRKIYFDNARKLLARSLPLPVMTAKHIARDFAPDGQFNESEWADGAPARIEYASLDSAARPELSTAVRALWSAEYLYLGYECPFTALTLFSPTQEAERFGLWDNDVVEAFIGSEPSHLNRYSEYEWAPSGEQLDLKLDLPEKDFAWSSRMQSAVRIDDAEKVWRVEVRIPFKSLAESPPQPGARWRINLFRHDTANKAFLAWNPTLKASFHTPEKFGWLEFKE
jgi:predicted TIM-barrel fold metal-dependent hydrolase